MITIRFPPMYSFMDYVFETYSKLDPECILKEMKVKVSDCVDCCSQSYYDSTQYNCNNSKKVYLIKYMATQIKQVNTTLLQSIQDDINGLNSISAVTLGGGPGTEAIALIDMLGDSSNDYDLHFLNIDIEETWHDIFEDLTQNFADRVNNVTLDKRFISTDIRTYNNSENSHFDVVFISWMLSLIKVPKDRLTILNVAKSLLKTDGYLVITDRTERKKVDKISNEINAISGLIQKEQGSIFEHCGISFPDEIRDAFKVRLNASSAYWVLQKR